MTTPKRERDRVKKYIVIIKKIEMSLDLLLETRYIKIQY